MKRALGLVAMMNLMVCLTWAQAPQRGAAPAAPPRGGAPANTGGGGGGRGGLVAQIRRFDATPTSIKAGESVVLSWATESGSASIDNGIGNVAPNGSARLTPSATTTYKLTVGNAGVTRSVTVTVTGTVAGGAAASNASARTIDGKPDFTGVYGGWNTNGPGGSRGLGAAKATTVPAGVETPYANLPGQPTLKPGVVNRGAPGNPAGGTADCLPLPADAAFSVPYPFQIIQSKNYFVFFFEYPGTFRIVPLDGTPHPADPDPTWMGDSVGHWEGQTLIIDTVGYNGKHSISGIQKPSEKFHTIERLSRTGTTGLFYEIIYEDPEFATGQWRSAYPFQIDTRVGLAKIDEFICENNRDYTPLFGAGGPPAPGAGGGGRGAAPGGAGPGGAGAGAGGGGRGAGAGAGAGGRGGGRGAGPGAGAGGPGGN